MPSISRAQLVNQKDLLVDELAAFADTIMLSQANLHNLMAEVKAHHHNSDILTVRQHSSASPTLPNKKKKKARVKPEICWFHGKYGKDAKSCSCPAPGRETGIGEAPRTRCLPLAAQAFGFQLPQSATSSDSGTDAPAPGSGSLPSQEPTSSC